MRILVFAQSRVWSGDSIFLLRLAQRWREQGDEACVFLAAPEEAAARLREEASVRRMSPRFDLDAASEAIQARAGIRRALALGLYYLRVPIQLAALWFLIRRRKPRMVFVNNASHPGWLFPRLAMAAAWLGGTPRIVYAFHNLTPRPLGVLARGLCAALEWPLRSRRVLACTFARDSLESFRRSVAHAPRLASAMRHPIPDLAREIEGRKARIAAVRAQAIGDGAALALYAGRLEERKGVRDLLEAWKRTVARFGGARLAIAGEGPLREELERLARELGVEKTIAFLGFQEQAADCLAAADAIVLPSLGMECSPLVTLEAMALGKPVAATSLPGLAEQIDHGVTGYLVKPGDAAALSRALVRLLIDRERRERMGAAARESWERLYSPKAFDLYFDVLLETAFPPASARRKNSRQ